jgi:glycerol-3-phosphate dehydrogenase (NAD(P)+)
VYLLARSLVQAIVEVLFRPRRFGRRHVPDGPVILASNHRSFLDPLVIGCSLRRRVFFMAKQELFQNRFLGWLLSRLGAFPVRRGESDEETTRTALELLARGSALVMFPEGTRIRPGALGTPKRGVGRLALESGAPVVPVAVSGTERARRGWLLRPVRVELRFGRPLRFPLVERPSPGLARAVTGRIWACVALQWEWLGGAPPLRTAAVVGAGELGTAMAGLLARAGLEVQLGCQTEAQAERLRATPEAQAERLRATRETGRHLPGVPPERPIAVRPLAELELARADLIVIAVPCSSLSAVVAQLGAQAAAGRSAALVVSAGLVPPLGSTPAAYVGARLRVRGVACLARPVAEREADQGRGSVVLASAAPDLRRELRELLGRTGLAVELTNDVVGTELAAAAAAAASLGGTAASALDADEALAGHLSARARLEGVRAAERGARPRAA